MSTQYNEGAATFTSGSQTVTGQGASWTPAMVGKRITRAGSGIAYQIAAVNSFTSLTLTANYAGGTESSVPYAIQIGETANYGFPEYDFQGVDPATFLNEFSWAVDGLLAPATSTTLGTVRVTSSSTDTTAGRVTKVGDGGLLGVQPSSSFDSAIGQPTQFLDVFDNNTQLNGRRNVLHMSDATNTVQTEIAARANGMDLDWRGISSGVATDWQSIYHTNNLIYAQNTSGGTIASNGTVAGSGLTPAQTGTWRNASGGDILNNGYGIWVVV